MILAKQNEVISEEELGKAAGGTSCLPALIGACVGVAEVGAVVATIVTAIEYSSD